MIASLNPTNREVAVNEELAKAADLYLEKKAAFDFAQIQYEAARNQFTAIREMAVRIVPRMRMQRWRDDHVEVRYTGLSLGEAIINVLEDYAHHRAKDHLDKEQPGRFAAVLSLERITTFLENGGFDFRSVTPQREVNAALMKLQGIGRPRKGVYQAVNAEEILEELMDLRLGLSEGAPI